MSTITIENVGPIKNLDIPIPENGGIVVLRGANGAGKTSALEATQRVLGGNQQLSCRDGCPKGQVSGLGVKITVGRSTRRTGELEAIHLEGKLSIAELVDPRLKNDDVADAKRIKAMVALSDTQADEVLFRDVIGEDLFVAAVNDDKAGLDLLEMSARIKADLHGYARRRESEAVSQQGKADGHRNAAGDPARSEVNETSLKTAMLSTAKEETSLREKRRIGLDLNDRIIFARKSLEENSYPTPEFVAEKEAICTNAIEATRKADSVLQAAVQSQAKLLEEIIGIRREAAKAAKFYDVISAAKSASWPSEICVESATVAAGEASEAWDKAVVGREAARQLALASECDKDAKRAAQKAVDARDAAKACDVVLERAIRSDVLTIRDGRLYVSTSRGSTLFSELSDGERWEIAIDLAADAVGKNGLLVVPQSAWEGLDSDNRVLIANRARERCITVITAEAKRAGENGELHVEVLS